MTDTPTSKVEALRGELDKLFGTRGMTQEQLKGAILQAFATFLEGLESQAETFSKDGKPLSDTNSIEAVPVEALHQVVTALRGGE